MAWFVTVDRVTTDPEDTLKLPSRVGWCSRDWPDDLPGSVVEAALKGVRLSMWRCLDDESNIYYAGLSTADPHTGGDELFAPLWDFAQPDAGACDIAYWNGKEWETI